MRYILTALFLLFCFFLVIPNGFAQNSISEIEENVNHSGKSRTSKSVRVTSEVGMGLAGALVGAGLSFGIGAMFSEIEHDGTHRSGASFAVSAGVTYELVTPVLIAGGTYLGGWLTGGRAKAGPVLGGAYAGAVTSYLFLIGFTGWGIAVNIVSLPILSLLGAVVGYELSEDKQTSKLKRERDKLNGQRTRSFEFVPTLYSFTF